MYLPEKIKEIIAPMKYDEDKEGKSRARVIHFYDDINDLYLKIEGVNDEVIREYEIYQWLQGKLPVPKVICRTIVEDISYMLIEGAKGKMLEEEVYRSNPEKLVALAAKGLKKLKKVPITDCPFDSTIDKKLELARIGIEKGLIDRIDRNIFTKGFNSPQEVYKYLIENKPREELVFTHGDYCFNNYFTDGKDITGFIDMGRGGIGDIYQDIALCVRELMDFEPKYTEMLMKKLGINPNLEKIKYYILLDELF